MTTPLTTGSDLEALLRLSSGTGGERGASGPVRASGYQRRIWDAHVAGDGSAYSIPCVVDVSGDVDLDRLVRAIRAVVAANTLLHSAVGGVRGRWEMDELDGELAVDHIRDVDDLESATADVVALPFASDNPGWLVRARLLTNRAGSTRLVLVFHHVVIDGVGLSLFVSDLQREYEIPGSSVVRPSYADVTDARTGEPDAERRWLTCLRGWAGVDVWSADATGRSEVGTVSRALVPTSAGAVARRLGVTEPAVWASATVLALSRILHARAVCLWIPLVNRHEVDEFEVIGPLVDTVPLVVEIDPALSLADLTRWMDDQLSRSLQRMNRPVADLVDELRAEIPDYWLPVDVFFNYQDVDRTTVDLGSGELRPAPTHTGALKAALTVSVQSRESTGTPGGEFQIESALVGWDEDTHHGMRAAVSEIVSRLETASERAVADTEFGVTGVPSEASTRSRNVVDALRERAARHPGDAAITAPDGVVTWSELVDGIDRRAALLVEKGVKRGNHVLLTTERDTSFVMWAGAAMALGAAYVPVDAAGSGERLGEIVTRTGAPVAVWNVEHAGTIRELGLEVIDRDSQGVSVASVPKRAADVGDVAYVIFTSGTTGRPKGVPVTHRNLLALVDATAGIIESDDAVSCLHAFTFDYSVWEIWCALAHGARVHIVDDETIRDPFLLTDALVAARVTVLSLTNTALGSLLAACRHSAESAAGLGRAVRRVVLGGEAVTPAYVTQWRELCGPDSEIVDMLGATETTVHSTKRILDARDESASSVSVGKALPYWDVLVVDADGHALPAGCGGEIAVRGAGVSLGYLGQSRLTADRFVPDPFPGADGRRLYLSGDLGRWTVAGGDPILLCHGRKDGQIKVRGHRIEATGVERVLESAEGVARSCVVVRQGSLVGYVELAASEVPATTRDRLDEVRRHARMHLASYEVPDRLHAVSGFPYTHNGKLDRDVTRLDALVVDDATTAAEKGRLDPFVVALETALSGQAVDLRLSFLANGGDSITAVQLVGELRAAGIGVGVGAILGAESLLELRETVAQNVTGTADNDEWRRLRPFDLVDEKVRDSLPFDVSDAYPLSAAQQGMLYHIRLDSDVGVYHNTVSVRLRGVLDPRAFRVAVADVMRRHDVLRTAVRDDVHEEPIQVVHREVEVPFRHVDATAVDDVDGLLDALVDEERRTPFELAVPPLFRITLVSVSDAENQLVLSDNHLILDGWSWTSTLAEIITRHNALVGRDPEYDATLAPDTRARFADFVAAERSARTSSTALEAWRGHLEGAAARSLADTFGSGVRNVRRYSIPIDERIAHALTERARTAQVSLRHLAMAVHYSVLSEVFDDDDVLSGLTANGRLERPGGIDTRGMFLNMIPLRVEVGDSLEETARRCARAEAGVAPHRRVPNIEISRAAGRGPLFDFGFNFVRFHRLETVEKTHTFGSGDDPHYSREDTDLAAMATFSVHPPHHRLALMLVVDESRVGADRVGLLRELYSAELADAATEYDSKGVGE